MPVDVTDPDSLARALAGADCVITSLPYRMNLLAMDAALAARVHYIDLGGLFHMTLLQRERHAAFRDAGLMAILGMGSAPGILNVMAAQAAEGMTRVRGGPLHGGRARRHPLADPAAAALRLLARHAARRVRPALGRVPRRASCRWSRRSTRPSAAASASPHPVGELDLDTTLHSEVATLPDFFRARGVREVTFRQGFEAGFADRLRLLVQLGLVDTTALPGFGRAPRDLLKALLARLPPPAPGRPHRPLRDPARARRRLHAAAPAPHGHRSTATPTPHAGGGIGPDIDTGAPPRSPPSSSATSSPSAPASTPPRR